MRLCHKILHHYICDRKRICCCQNRVLDNNCCRCCMEAISDAVVTNVCSLDVSDRKFCSQSCMKSQNNEEYSVDDVFRFRHLCYSFWEQQTLMQQLSSSYFDSIKWSKTFEICWISSSVGSRPMIITETYEIISRVLSLCSSTYFCETEYCFTSRKMLIHQYLSCDYTVLCHSFILYLVWIVLFRCRKYHICLVYVAWMRFYEVSLEYYHSYQ
jgi:hypothetical protein